MKNVKEFFNDNINDWSESVLNEKRLCKIVETFYNCYSKAKTNKPKILDIGCGIGYESKILSDFGAKVTGVDFSENVIRSAKANVQNVDFVVADITKSLEDLGRFDGVLCLETLDYIDNDNIKNTFDNIATIMKSGALLLISVLDGDSKNEERSYIKVGDKEYDKNFYCYSAEALCTYAYPNFKLVDTWQFNDFNEGWRYYIFMKQSVNK
ncbi:MAG: class I SAM-dependent methyltransferase [Clostridia bacterium]|nr:class I SAM-dependent methyltransferase [Clostridia bacterium]